MRMHTKGTLEDTDPPMVCVRPGCGVVRMATQHVWFLNNDFTRPFCSEGCIDIFVFDDEKLEEIRAIGA